MRADHRALLILAPIEFDAKELDIVRVHEASAEDDRTRLASWQELYAMMVAWRSGTASGSVAVWLVNEFLHFLREQGLEERPISRQDVEALNGLNAAVEALAGVTRQAEALISRSWAKRLGPKNPTYTDEVFRYPIMRRGDESGEAWADAELQWTLHPASGGEETSIWAGLQSGAAGPLGYEGNDAWIRSLEGKGFRSTAHRKTQWLGRSLPLVELAALLSTGDQAKRLTEFVVDAFEAVTAITPSQINPRGAGRVDRQ